jgi:hypothetical protein
MKTWAILLLFIQIGFSIRFEFYELDDLIAIANNGVDMADHKNKTQSNSENLNDPSGVTKEGENEEKVLKMMTRIKRKAGFSIPSKSPKQELNMGMVGAPTALLFHIIDLIV